jgi:hypothetical protein
VCLRPVFDFPIHVLAPPITKRTDDFQLIPGILPETPV